MFPYIVRPTRSPSNAPTAVPIAPTKEPTTTATFLCDGLYAFFSGFDEVDADTLNGNATLQSVMANITHRAVVPSASANDIESHSFFVHFQNASEALSITFSLCAQSKVILNSLQYVVNMHSEDIDDAMKDGIAVEFGSDPKTFNVSVNTEFGFHFSDINISILLRLALFLFISLFLVSAQLQIMICTLCKLIYQESTHLDTLRI